MRTNPAPELTLRSLAVLSTVSIAITLSGAQFASTSISVFLARINADYGWSRAQIGGAVTMLYIGMAAGAPLFGIAADRFGARAVMLPLTLLSGLLIGCFAATGSSLLIFYGAHLLLGLAQPGMVAYSKTISTWFARRRAVALSMLAIGALVSQIFVPPLAQSLLERVGWHRAYLVFGAAEIIVALPLLILFFRDRPSKEGVTDAGRGQREEPVVAAGAAGLRQAMSTRIYWQLVLSQACVSFCFLSTSVHAVGILAERGVPATAAVWGLSTFAIGGVAAKIVMGHLLDRVGSPRVIAPFALVSLLSLLALDLGHGEAFSLMAMFLFGFGCIACGCVAYLITRYFGVRSFSAIYGSTMPIMIVLGAGSPVLSGYLYDRTGTYSLALTITILVMLAGFVLIATLPPYRLEADGRERPSSAR